jgi:hypothetical protein
VVQLEQVKNEQDGPYHQNENHRAGDKRFNASIDRGEPIEQEK